MAKAQKASSSQEIEVVNLRQGEITFCVLGVTALYCNSMSGKGIRELLLPRGRLTAAQKTTNLKHDPYAEFRNSVDRRGDGVPGPTRILMPSTAFKGALASAALDMPTGVAKTQISRLVWVMGEAVDVYGIPKMSMEIVRSADMNKTPDVRTRAVLEEWACRVTFRFIEPNLSSNTLGILFSAAGMVCGVGDKRQQKGAGNQGQFCLVGEDDATFQRIIKNGGMAAQDAALNEATPRDSKTEELLTWFDDEIDRRGKHKTSKPTQAIA